MAKKQGRNRLGNEVGAGVVSLALVRFRRSSSKLWEYYQESLTIPGATKLAQSLNSGGVDAAAITIELSDAELTKLIARKANEVTL